MPVETQASSSESNASTEVMVVVGTRPEAIKMAPVVIEGRKKTGVNITLCNTGQHRELSNSALAAFGLEPDFDLDIMSPNQSLTDVTTAVLNALSPELAARRPDWVVVQGDTTTAFASALAAFYHKIPVAHVEAGLRTGNIHAPWPEEMNRKLISAIASLHFAPTDLSAANLAREGISGQVVVVSGNTVVDALKLIWLKLESDASFKNEALEALHAAGFWRAGGHARQPIVVVTCHRRESFGIGLENICLAIRNLAVRFPEHQFVYPLHPNPNVRTTVDAILRQAALPNVHLIQPIDYVPFVALLADAELILTDSGGLQEEGISLGKRVIVMREVSERMEGIATGLGRLAGLDRQAIETSAGEALTGVWAPTSKLPNPFGDGFAAVRIIAELQKRR